MNLIISQWSVISAATGMWSVGRLSVALYTVLFALCVSAQAQQQKKIPRIGFLFPSGERNTPGFQLEAFRQGLRELGYTDKKNILIEYRGAEGKQDRIPSLVTELVQLKVDALVITNLPAIRAAKQATQTIPIVINYCRSSRNGAGRQLGAPGRQYHGSNQTISGIERKTA